MIHMFVFVVFNKREKCSCILFSPQGLFTVQPDQMQVKMFSDGICGIVAQILHLTRTFKIDIMIYLICSWPHFLQTVNPILILALVPIVDNLVYPLIKKCGLNFTWVFSGEPVSPSHHWDQSDWWIGSQLWILVVAGTGLWERWPWVCSWRHWRLWLQLWCSCRSM